MRWMNRNTSISMQSRETFLFCLATLSLVNKALYESFHLNCTLIVRQFGSLQCLPLVQSPGRVKRIKVLSDPLFDLHTFCSLAVGKVSALIWGIWLLVRGQYVWSLCVHVFVFCVCLGWESNALLPRIPSAADALSLLSRSFVPYFNCPKAQT